MRGDYGCDDIDWLESQSKVPGTIAVEAHGRTFNLAIGRFDNRVDRTTFLHGDRVDWPAKEVEVLHNELKGALDKIFETVNRD